MQRQLEGVDVTRRVVDGEGDGGARGTRVVGTTPRPSSHIRGTLSNGEWLSVQIEIH